MEQNFKSEVVIFNDSDISLEVNISPTEETVWLSLNDVSELFEKNKSTISRHINNIFNEGELDKSSTVAKNATVQIEGNREIIRDIDYYNLDVVISVGYRVKSKRATRFRKWATSVLKDYAIKGYAINNNKIDYNTQLKLLKLLERTTNQLESLEILAVLENYTLALQLLDDYDHQIIQKPKGKLTTYRLDYQECIEIVN